jgi:hypothetical protein
LAALTAYAADSNDIKLQDNAPDRYVVQKGDTLWGISGKFLKDPWRWPEVWRMNKEQIKNPHWIYPGNVIVLDRSGATPQLKMGGDAGGRETVRLSPTVRVSDLEQAAIPSIPPGVIEPFLNRPLVIEPNTMLGTGRIVAAEDDRVAITSGVKAYAYGVPEGQGTTFQVYRLGDPIVSPRLNATLGYEANYLGDVRVTRFGEVSTLEVLNGREEMAVGDRLLPVAQESAVNYVPHAPQAAVEGSVIKMPGGVAEVGRGSIVAVDLGRAQGMEIGHVLALSHPGPVVPVVDEREPPNMFGYAPAKLVQVPNERYGLLFIFRVFDSVSYGLVLNSSSQVRMGDSVSKP